MLKVVTEGLKAAPAMNAHIDFNRKLVRGCVKEFKDINISMSMVLNDGRMMTINLHNFEDKSLHEMRDYVLDVRRRMENTNLTEAMYSVSLDNTLTGLKKGKIGQTLCRVIGSKTGKYKVRLLKGKEKKEYEKIPQSDRLTKYDIEQGTTTISNIGSLYLGQKGGMALLEIVPPQVSAFGIGAVQEKPAVVKNENGESVVAVRKIMPICIAFDHRALDFGDIIPFMKKLDEIFANPSLIDEWMV